MDKIDDGGQAFPSHTDVQGLGYLTYRGMTLRDWFAGQAMIGLISAGVANGVPTNAYRVADAMLEARKVKS
jgi:hypothetical protein